ncbi:signal transducer [Gigaspora margarita]|uniref:Signal transducer n=1 Tax=Gigaspora margarita TaxID=4874 RepID=A0A8H3XJU0_GIGMA|nr:signal transducer [Gigaspora margarita]
MEQRKANETLKEIVKDLLSYDENCYKDVLDRYFDQDAKLSHPLLNVEGTPNIRKVFRVWTSLNCRQPDFDPNSIVFDVNGPTAVIQVTQHLSPRIFPFIDIKVPSLTILTFKKHDDGLLYIEKQEDNWTLEGLIKSVPLINWWYDRVVRVVVGNLMAHAGSFLATANRATSQLRDNSQSAIAQGQNTAKEYLGPIKDRAQSYLTPAQDFLHDGIDQAKSAIWNAQKGVKDQFSKVAGTGHPPHTNGNIQTPTHETTAY